MFSLYLGLEDDFEDSKIWLGGYDRQVIKRVIDRSTSAASSKLMGAKSQDTEAMSDEEIDA